MKLYLLVFVILLQLNLDGQVINYLKTSDNPAYSEEDLKLFKQTKTIFFYHPFEKELVDKIESLVKEFWKITEIEFVPFEKKEQYVNDYSPDSFSFFRLYSKSITYEKDREIGIKFFVQRQLEIYKNGKTHELAHIHLRPEMKSYNRLLKEGYFDLYDHSHSKIIRAILDKEYLFYNNGPGYTAMYLRMIHNSLMENETMWMGSKKVLTKDLIKMSQGTLLVDEVFFEWLGFYTQERKKMVEPEKFFKKYEYKYEVVEMSRVNEFILQKFDTDTYMLFYSKAKSQSNFFYIVNLKNMDLVYSNYSTVTNPYSRDVKKINKAIKKASK